MLPTVDFCGIDVTRLIIGANPFGGYSHQNPERDAEMVSYYTVERIIETWGRAEAAGINTMITNNETPHVLEAVDQYLSNGGVLQWIAQVSGSKSPTMFHAIDAAVESGCKGMYFHGGAVDKLFDEGKDVETLTSWLEHAQSQGVFAGVAGHDPRVHRWVDSLDVADFHAVCFFNCGSLHSGKGEKFYLGDAPEAARCAAEIQKPCIGYKILGAGRIEPRMAFEFAFENIKTTDVVNVGMHRGDNDNMVEENVAIVEGILAG
ncbi:MAG: hypothetical protein HN742_03895 [Lentisphaerae bacterium]|jgi:hypothetical protein|nr:hypothetical protein [Lentisphaerota bacterium]MBT4820857.1 hypothetical protein [Lentisphaerota bacterium]MBT5607295.1 hypothetical protein [Lentisphaerota bacterium]MBT7055387.1 hypothetical protein [Lentisphaerota bacterium]MBT7840985.1 hypothetical protein [Lentisphaerota bacterium]